MNTKLNKYALNIFLAALFVSPLIFFTDLTRNPYLIQERVYQVLLSVALILLYLSAKKEKVLSFPSTFLDKPLFLFLGVALVSVVLSLINYPEFRRAITGYAGRRMLMFLFCGFITFYVTAGFAEGEKAFKKIIKAITGAASVSSFYAVLQFMNLDFIWRRGADPYGQRSISTFGNPNFFSSFLIIAIFFIVGRIYAGDKNKDKSPVFLFGLLLLNLAGLAITMTRSSYAGLAVGIVIISFYFIKKTEKSMKRPLIIFLALILFTGGIFSLASGQFRTRLKSFFSVEKMGKALTQRLLIWESSCNMFEDTPVIGRGWGNFEIFYPFYQGKIMEKEVYRNLRTHANNCHNIFLELLTQTGITGAGIYIFLVFVFIKFSFKIYKEADGADKIWTLIFTAAAISFWIDNILNVSMFFPMPAFAFWVNAGLLAGLGRKYLDCGSHRINLGGFYKGGLLVVIISAIGVTYFNGKYFFSSVHFFKGFKYSRMGRLDLAERELEKAHKIYSLIVDNNYELGNVYARRAAESETYLKKAVWAYNEALAANPGYDEIYFNLGIMHLKSGDQEKAEKYLQKTLEINPLTFSALRTLGDLRAAEGNFGEAAGYYSRAVQLNPEDLRLLVNYGYCLQQSGDLVAAASYYFLALKKDSSYKAAAERLRYLAHNITPEVKAEIIALFKEAANYVRRNEWEKALEPVKKILSLNPADGQALLYAGNIYYHLGLQEKARKYYEIILAINPENETVRSNLEAINKKQ